MYEVIALDGPSELVQAYEEEFGIKWYKMLKKKSNCFGNDGICNFVNSRGKLGMDQNMP